MKPSSKELASLWNAYFNSWIEKRGHEVLQKNDNDKKILILEINIIHLLRDEIRNFQDNPNDSDLIKYLSEFLEKNPERKELCELLNNILQEIYKWEVDVNRRQKIAYEQWLNDKISKNVVVDDEGYDTEPYADEDGDKDENRNGFTR